MSTTVNFEALPRALPANATTSLAGPGERLPVAWDVAHALARGELHLAYQPIYRLSTGRMTKVEALLRWQRRGVSTAPDEFIPWMEEFGVIVSVGKWVAASACEQATAWNEGGTPMRVSFNVSPRQLEAGDFPAAVREALARTRCKPEWIEVEITEHCVMRDFERIRRALGELSELGVSIAIDDFGTGYSSLARLAHLPAQSIKLDRALVAGAHEEFRRAAIVDSIVNLCATLGLEVTAEGVEHADDAAYLSRFGRICVQGYLFSRPMPPDRVLPG